MSGGNGSKDGKSGGNDEQDNSNQKTGSNSGGDDALQGTDNEAPIDTPPTGNDDFLDYFGEDNPQDPLQLVEFEYQQEGQKMEILENIDNTGVGGLPVIRRTFVTGSNNTSNSNVTTLFEEEPEITGFKNRVGKLLALSGDLVGTDEPRSSPRPPPKSSPVSSPRPKQDDEPKIELKQSNPEKIKEISRKFTGGTLKFGAKDVIAKALSQNHLNLSEVLQSFDNKKHVTDLLDRVVVQSEENDLASSLCFVKGSRTFGKSGKTKNIIFSDALSQCVLDHRKDKPFSLMKLTDKVFDIYISNAESSGTLFRGKTGASVLQSAAGKNFAKMIFGSMEKRCELLANKISTGIALKMDKIQGNQETKQRLQLECAQVIGATAAELLQELASVPLPPEMCSATASLFNKVSKTFGEQVALAQVSGFLVLRVIAPALTDLGQELSSRNSRGGKSAELQQILTGIGSVLQALGTGSGVPRSMEIELGTEKVAPFKVAFGKLTAQLKFFLDRVVAEGQKCQLLLQQGLDLDKIQPLEILRQASLNGQILESLFMDPTPEDPFGLCPVSAWVKLAPLLGQARQDKTTMTLQKFTQAVENDRGRWLQIVLVRRTDVVKACINLFK